MPRAGLTRDRVTRIACELVELGGVNGYARLSLAAVAERAGVAAPSLYRHVASLDALKRAVSAEATTALTTAIADAVIGVSGPEAIQALAAGVRAFAHEHPGIYMATQVGADPKDPDDHELSEAAARTLRVIGGALRAFRIPDDALVDVIRSLRASLHGFIVIELMDGYRLGNDLDESFELHVSMIIAGVEAAATRLRRE